MGCMQEEGSGAICRTHCHHLQVRQFRHMSLDARRALYFLLAVTARYLVTPAPASSREVQHLYRSFQKLGPVEYFHVDKLAYGASGVFGQQLTVSLNSHGATNTVGPPYFSEIGPAKSVAELQLRQSQLAKRLSSICGIPRHSYLDENRLLWSDGHFVPFTHSLVLQGRHLVEQYEISESSHEDPFFTIDSELPPANILPYLRHNFSKLHKFEPIFVHEGAKGIGRATNIHVDRGLKHLLLHAESEFDLGKIMDLGEDLALDDDVRGFTLKGRN